MLRLLLKNVFVSRKCLSSLKYHRNFVNKGSCIQCFGVRHLSSIYEPEGFDYVPEIPEYAKLDLKFSGHDFVVIESFTQYVNSLLRNSGHNLYRRATPTRKTKAVTFKPGGTFTKDTYNLNVHERSLHLRNVPNTALPLLFEVIRQNLPEGVKFVAQHPNPEDEAFRYVPDVVRGALEDQLEEIDKNRDERKK